MAAESNNLPASRSIGDFRLFAEHINERGIGAATGETRLAHSFLKQARGLTSDDWKMFVWDDNEKALGLPIANNNKVVGVQWRYFNGKIKYLTQYFVDDKLPFYQGVGENTPLVVVEDILSAMCLNNAGYDSLALLSGGSRLNRIYHNIKYYTHFVVWLDNDNRHIKTTRSKIKRMLEPFGTVELVRDLSDPKHYTIDALREVIDGQT